MTIASEDVRAPTHWVFNVPHHTLIVHLGGRLSMMESKFQAGQSNHDLPSVGDICIIPARWRYVALVQGNTVRFAEFQIPTEPGKQAELIGRTGYRDPFLYQASAKASQLAERSDDVAVMAMQSLLDTLRFHIADTYLKTQANNRISRATDKRAFTHRQRQRVADHIADMRQNPLRVEELAQVAGVSVTSFFAKFKATFATTPWKYVTRVRLTEAHRLLSETPASVTDIAAATGFSSSSHFATSFIKFFGESPSEYRRRHGSQQPQESIDWNAF